MVEQSDNLKREQPKSQVIPMLLLLLAILGGAWLLEKGGALNLNNVSPRRFVAGLCWAGGALAWIVTYVGAPLASKCSGHHVSGIPGIPFLAFLIAGLLSSCQWLALLCLSDLSVVLLLRRGNTRSK